MKQNRTCLIIAEDSPESHGPAGERLRLMALESNSFFSKTIVLTQGKIWPQGSGKVGSKTILYKTGFVRATPFPISAFFEPIRLLAFLIYGGVLSARYRPSHIIALMPPFETGVGGLLLTRLLRSELIIDYMDYWEGSLSSYLTRYVPEVLLELTFRFARRIYSSATVIFAVTSRLANIIKEH